MKRSKTHNVKKKKKSTKFSLILKVLLLLSASLLICVTAYGVYITKKAEFAVKDSYEVIEDRPVSEKREAKVEPIQDNVSILFVGVDDSEKRGQGAENSRSDALLLATLNNEDKTVKLVSIPRDSYVYIPEIGYNDKITHAHAFGGTRATIETVEELFDIPVDYYVRMNFDAFIDVVDALGGIEVDVDIPYAFTEKDENDRYTVKLEPGLQQLNGSQALSLARTRKHDSDVMRGKRQQDILKAIAKKAASVSSITKYDDIIEAIGDNMKTDMTFDEMKSFFSYVSKGIPQIDTLTLQGYDDMSTGVYYYQLDQESLSETQHILKSHLGLIPDTSDISSTTPEKETAVETELNFSVNN
ncbi:LCP family protein [Ureibacillus endophyticus]|uniref:LytR family transcriptional regulator n=1 Tax=Ureibacillus endophyticus TaxID=1978490 RepID=A0A494YWQ4_9BACL|nr:LCP family protein [Lysinibacillus endophyticus]RKQ14573.1 LytR family transcriptional regulator [Lysinibacillus endophyticus]